MTASIEAIVSAARGIDGTSNQANCRGDSGGSADVSNRVWCHLRHPDAQVDDGVGAIDFQHGSVRNDLACIHPSSSRQPHENIQQAQDGVPTIAPTPSGSRVIKGRRDIIDISLMSAVTGC